ncbi:hypothetical protein B0H63DRAFT_551323 [Podospora didyma]|uniref:RING-type domain-containing protein n=1 Tax=Podospora didyma TaxID=330526 RepID=A0AAE0KAS7_9PEZI|nr:hypothetical protein B0H63DRAFT_551323 [Podospora didyma]
MMLRKIKNRLSRAAQRNKVPRATDNYARPEEVYDYDALSTRCQSSVSASSRSSSDVSSSFSDPSDYFMQWDAAMATDRRIPRDSTSSSGFGSLFSASASNNSGTPSSASGHWPQEVFHDWAGFIESLPFDDEPTPPAVPTTAALPNAQSMPLRTAIASVPTAVPPQAAQNIPPPQVLTLPRAESPVWEKPLMAQGSANEEKDCVICADSKPLNEFPLLCVSKNCNHSPDACLDCIQRQLRMAMEDKIWCADVVTCSQCNASLEYNEVQLYADRATFEK